MAEWKWMGEVSGNEHLGANGLQKRRWAIKHSQRMWNVSAVCRSTITGDSDARCTRQIIARAAVTKAALSRKIFFFQQQIEFKSKEATSEVPSLEHSFVWC